MARAAVPAKGLVPGTAKAAAPVKGLALGTARAAAPVKGLALEMAEENTRGREILLPPEKRTPEGIQASFFVKMCCRLERVP